MVKLRRFVCTLALSCASLFAQNAAISGVLTPTLQPAIGHVRFSPDGRFILAQSDAGIFVLTMAPLEVAFRIDAQNASYARFTSDSKRIVFEDDAATVEEWDAVSRNRLALHPVPHTSKCTQKELSPNGNLIACLREGSLELIAVDSGAILYTRAASAPLTFDFSPDGRYLLAMGSRMAFAYDSEVHAEVRLPRQLTTSLGEHFAWVAADKLGIVNASHPERSAIFHFPSGERLIGLPLRSDTKIAAATKGDYLLISSKSTGGIGIYDIFRQKIIGTHDSQTVDIFNNYAITDTGRNGIILFDSRFPEFAGIRITLNGAPARDIRLVSVSPDLKYLAISTRRRSSIYRLESGRRIGDLRPMNAALFSGPSDDVLYADFPRMTEDAPAERTIGALNLTGAGSDKILEKLADDEAEVRTAGTVRLISSRRTLEAQEGAGTTPLWTRSLPGDQPTIDSDEDCPYVVLHWPLASPTAIAMIAHSSGAGLQQKAAELTGHPGARLLEILDGKSGATLRQLVVDAGETTSSLHIAIIGDAATIIHPQTTEIVSLKPGSLEQISLKREARALRAARTLLDARYSSHSSASGTLALIHGTSEVQLTDAQTGIVMSSYAMPSSVRFTAFSQDGNCLFVLTEDQHYQIIPLTPVVEARTRH